MQASASEIGIVKKLPGSCSPRQLFRSMKGLIRAPFVFQSVTTDTTGAVQLSMASMSGV